MPITLTELVDSRPQTMGRDADGKPRLEGFTLHYKLEGTDDDAEARATMEASTPATWDDLSRGPITLEPDFVDEVSGEGLWDVHVEYNLMSWVRDAGEYSFEFDTGGGMMHLSQSLQTISRTAPAGKTAPNFKGAIGVSGSGPEARVEGVDVGVPVYHFAISGQLADSVVTEAYRGVVFRLTHRTNNAPFQGLAAGECAFLGAHGSQRIRGGVWTARFHFAGSPNLANINIGDIIVPEKLGWDYLWVRYATDVDAAAKQLVERPIAAYVERVLYSGDFTDLLIDI